MHPNPSTNVIYLTIACVLHVLMSGAVGNLLLQVRDEQEISKCLLAFSPFGSINWQKRQTYGVSYMKIHRKNKTATELRGATQQRQENCIIPR